MEESIASHASLTSDQIILNVFWDEHIRHAYSTFNPDATIDTMVTDADVNPVAVRTGEASNEMIHKAYREKQPQDQRRRDDSR